MNEFALTNYYQQIVNDFHLRFNRVYTTSKPGEIHRLRLALKKIRIILALVAKASPQRVEKDQYQCLFLPLFTKAGRVRESQINLVLISRYSTHELNPFRNHLKSKLHTDIKKFRKELRHFDQETFAINNTKMTAAIQRLPSEKLNKVAVDYILSTINSIIEKKDRKPVDISLHQIRTSIKKALGVSTVLSLEEANSCWKKFIDFGSRLERKIGKWHDYTILIDSLKEFYTSKPPRSQDTAATKIIAKIENANTKRQKSIINKLDSKLKRKLITRIQTSK